MRLVFYGVDRPIVIRRGHAYTVEVENPCLYARICRSLVASGGEAVFEQFSIWDDEGAELTPARAFFAISDPLHLPWDSTELSGRLLTIMESLLFESEDMRGAFEDYGRRLQSLACQLTHQVECDYGFNVEWDVRRYLKSFGFSADRGESLPYIDMLNMFLDYVSDMHLKKTLVFVNLKTFLTEKEFQQFLDRVFFHEFEVLLLENKSCGIDFATEDKMVVDQHFLEI